MLEGYQDNCQGFSGQGTTDAIQNSKIKFQISKCFNDQWSMVNASMVNDSTVNGQ